MDVMHTYLIDINPLFFISILYSLVFSIGLVSSILSVTSVLPIDSTFPSLMFVITLYFPGLYIYFDKTDSVVLV